MSQNIVTAPASAKIFGSSSRALFYFDIFQVELKALIGLIYMRGLLGANLLDAKQLWTSNYSPVFAATMSYHRFSFLLSHLRMDDIAERDQARQRDKFAAARKLLEMFNVQCAKGMQCGEYICFDETLYPNRGQGYGFRIYIKGKPWKFGILYRSLNDSEVPYTYQVHVCAGKPAGEPTEDYVKGAAKAVGKCLDAYVAQGNEVKGRNITIDRGYGHIDLIKELGDKYRLTVISTICSNRKGLPKHFRDARGRPEGDYEVLFDVSSNMSIHSEIVRKKSG